MPKTTNTGTNTAGTAGPMKAKRPPTKAKGDGNCSLAERLTDVQLVALSRACQREDRMIAIPDALEDIAIRSFAEGLIALGLADEAATKRGDPVWRQDSETDEPVTLRVTEKALAVLGIDDGQGAGDACASEAKEEIGAGATSNGDQDATQERIVHAKPRRRPTAGPGISEAGPRQPRPGSKQGALMDMLSRDEGASIAELATALGWLPHTTRAALTGLRHKGYTLGRAASVDERGSVYRIIGTPMTAPTPDADTIATAA